VNDSTETLLTLLLVALYIKDCVILLSSEEAVLTTWRGKRWSAGFGARTWKIAGKEPFIANPFLPNQVVFRLRWRMSPSNGKKGLATRVPVQVPPELIGLGYLAWLTWFDLFVVLPTCLLGRLGPSATISVIGLLYAGIVASLALAWIWRRRLGVESRAFALLAFECIVCPPYAANIVRKIAALRRVDEDFELAARRLLDARHFSNVRLQCLARLDEQIERVGEDDAEFDALRQARKRFLPSQDCASDDAGGTSGEMVKVDNDWR
jgi:hypothetical protein